MKALERVALAAVIVAAVPNDAIAQPRSAEEGLGDIVVTAQKRAENVQDVPLSISVITGDDMAVRGVSSTQRLETLTPGLMIGNQSGYGQPFIRAVGSDNSTVSSEQPVAVYLDGVYLSALGSLLQEFSDVDRVEILKGPQGTLYGRNATGGAINIITKLPNGTTEGQLSLLGGNYGQARASGYIGGGSETLAASISGIYTRHRGFVRNLIGSRLDNENLWGTRGKLRWRPNDAWDLVLSADFTKRTDASGAGQSQIAERPIAVAFGGRVSTRPRVVYNDTPGYQRSNDGGVALTARGELGAVDFVSISSWRRRVVRDDIDLDGSDLPIVELPDRHVIKNISQEFQLLSNNDSSINWLVGAYYFHQDVRYDPLEIRTPLAPPPRTIIQSRTTGDAYSLFGQATVALNDRFSLTGGLRYNYEKKRLERLDVTVPGIGLVVNTPQTQKSWSNLSPKILIEYKVAETLLYASASKGFRSGSYNLASPGAIGPVNPEKILAFEVGGKHDISRSLRFNWAGFLYKYNDLQVQIIDSNGSGVTRLENAAKATIYGVDADLRVRILPELTGTLQAAYLHSKYDNYANASVFVPDPATGGFGFTSVVRNVSGNRLIRSPDLTLAAELRYETELDFGKLGLSGSYYYNDGFYFDAANAIRQRSYSLVSASADLTFGQSGLTASLFVTNLFDKDYLTAVAVSALGTLGTYSQPRLFGGKLSYRF